MIKKEYVYIFLFLIVFVTAFLLISSLKNFIFHDESLFTLDYGVDIAFRSLFCTLIFAFIYKSGLKRFSGLLQPLVISNVHFLFLPTLFIVLVIISETDKISSLITSVVILMVISNLLIGLLEEGLVRGIVLPLLIKYGSGRFNFIWALVVSSIVFGLLHYINLVTDTRTFEEVTGQVIYATAIGCFLGGMSLANNSILPAIILHATIDFLSDVNGHQTARHIDTISLPMPTEEGSQWPTLFFFLTLVALGIYMSQQSDKGKILSRLENVTLPFYSLLFGKRNAKSADCQ